MRGSGFGGGSGRLLIGLLLAVAGAVLTGWGIYHVMEIGTCASGGAFESVRQCPEGTSTSIYTLVGGILLTVVGALLAGLGPLIVLFVFLGIGLGSIAAGIWGDSSSGSFPLWFGVMFTAFAFTPLVVFGFFRGKQRKAQRLMATGRKGVGTVQAVTDTGVTVNDNPRVKITFLIEPQDGGPAYEAVKTTTVSRVQVPRVGDRYPVWIDPADPNEFAFGMAQTAEARQQVKEQFGIDIGPGAASGFGNGAGSGFASDAPAGGAGDPLDRVAKLNALRQAGAISEDEYQRLKAEILRDV